MVTKSVSREILRLAPLLKLLAILVLVALVPLIVYLAAYLWGVASDSQGTFHAVTALADLDGDGDLDVILANVRQESETTSFAGITLWLNQGAGKFTRSDQDLPHGFSAAAGDVDGDGDADLLVLNGYELTLSLNQGGAQGGKVGVFKTNNPIQPANDWHGHMDMGGSVVLGDLNNDGQVDGFVAGCCYLPAQQRGEDGPIPSSSWVWINEWDARGWLVRHTLSLGELDGLPVRATALGDLDGDGDLDVFAAIGTSQSDAGSILADRVLLNDRFGNLTDSGQRLGETESTSVALGDVDGDGNLDALVGTRNGAVVWRNQGGKSGMFSLMQAIAGSQTDAVFLADLEGDGDLDALIAGARRGELWWNNGLGTFTRSEQHFDYSNRQGLAIGDFNGDGRLDIFAGDDSGAYLLWINEGGGTFRAGEGG